ncbi:hypothetical protein [Rhizobium laguerreae]|uniref:hypothetical protein n=1 Tax=Rhizobium laguerreae TaxID=1076926 RepID=UPI001C920918|nr:hypothetical protein [Rhizobium laguerreae]MBY3344910.1 hypothetical protein [Rhizobium laguerreae]MBY3351944.1 hypothetical protein [Rhizobium laguerreae]MBY3372617.1 hypothetical protein [Rhizobium laguerreae]MBY3427784.1 hypothetical protein [Rhizobium laguerreae]MBY3436794.1 hypothetical protein [Rhizobium laguerreae]
MTVEAASATWKFDFLDTVNADPQCTPACLKVIKAYLHFASEASPVAFMAKSELVARTDLGEATIKRTRKLLSKLGYLKAIGKTAEGAVQYRLHNARKQTIDEHIILVREKLAEDRREGKKLFRARSALRGDQNDPSKNAMGGSKGTPRSDQNEPQIPRLIPRGIFSEGRDNLTASGEFTGGTQEKQPKEQIGLSETAGYEEMSRGDDPDEPIPVLSDQDEAQAMTEAICDGRAVPDIVRRRLQSMLQAGVLTPRMASNILAPVEDAA